MKEGAKCHSHLFDHLFKLCSYERSTAADVSESHHFSLCGQNYGCASYLFEPGGVLSNVISALGRGRMEQ